MAKRIIAAILTAIMMMSMAAGCSSGDNKSSRDKRHEEKEERSSSSEKKLYELAEDAEYDSDEMNDKYLEFVTELFEKCTKNEGDNNVMISPASVFFALEMAAAGASGETLDQMTQVLMPGVTNEEALRFAADYMDNLSARRGLTLHVANSVWIRDNVADYVYDDYLDYVRENFNAQAMVEPFDQDTVDAINDWIDENTDGMIDRLFEELDPDNIMILINAIAFEGSWAEQYEEYQVIDGEFTTADGTVQNVDMLYGSESVYLENDLATGFMKSYEGGQYAFVAMLPKEENMTGNELAQAMSAEDYHAFIDSAAYQYDVYTRLPEFSYDYEVPLKDILEDMGMTDAFGSDTADFSNIASSDDMELYISEVLHKTHIELDRTGTRAAAVTAVIMEADSALPDESMIREVYLDRPFAYAIINVETGLPVFIGTVNHVL